MTIEEYKTAFLDYWNNCLTIERYAEHKSITVKEALIIIETGKHFYDKDANKGEEVRS